MRYPLALPAMLSTVVLVTVGMAAAAESATEIPMANMQST